jgi:hypothetical protein
MSKTSLTRLTLLCAALAACSTDTKPTLTAPDARFALGEVAADFALAYSPDGPFDLAQATEDASATLAAAQIAAAPRAAAGSRSSGHVGFPSGWPGTVIAAEKYSYVAVSTDPATLAAKGQYEITLTTTTGNTRKVHGDVTCMNVFGNTARVGGVITKYWVDGVEAPIPPTGTHNIWVVVDNGEGAANPDQVSLMRFGPAVAAQTFCATGFSSVVTANQEGNIQVQP